MCFISLSWVAQTLGNVLVFDTLDKHSASSQAVYVVLSCFCALNLSALAFLPLKYTALNSILQIVLYVSSTLHTVVVHGAMGIDSEVVHAIFGSMALLCQPFTFKHMIPFLSVMFICNVVTNIVQFSPYTLLNCVTFIIFVALIWERENMIRVRWSTDQRLEPGILTAQRHAIHDVRNVLQEVLAIVEIESKKTSPSSLSSSPASSSSSSSSPTGASLGGIELREKEVETTTTTMMTSASRVWEYQKRRGCKDTPTTDPPSSSASSSTGSVPTAPSSLSSSSSSSADPSADPSQLTLRVREAVSRMTKRLETSLRDGRNTVVDEMSRLVPEIGPCNLGKMICEDYVLDPLVVVQLSSEFPKMCETDSEWMKTVVLNLVSNAKKHGPNGCPVQVSLSWSQDTSAIHIAVTDEGVGVSPARSRAIWSGDTKKETGGRIGIGAIKSYIDGLGGTYGNDGPVFWVQVPGGMTHSSFTMSAWTMQFVSKKAEQQFMSVGHKPTTVWTISTAGLLAFLVASFYSASDGQGFGRTKETFFTPELGVVYGICLITSILNIGVVYFEHRPTTQWWCRTIVTAGYILMDTGCTLLVINTDINDLTVCELNLKYIPGAGLIVLNTLAFSSMLNIPGFTHLFPMFLVFEINRVLMTISPLYYNDVDRAFQTLAARALHVLLVLFGFYFLGLSELKRRKQYVAGFTKNDVKRELRILELSARARSEEVQRAFYLYFLLIFFYIIMYCCRLLLYIEYIKHLFLLTTATLIIHNIE